VQLAVPDRATAARPFVALLAAVVADEDAVAPLGARRTTLRAGRAAIELLSPDGPGAVAAHLAQAGPGLFAAGFATADLAALRARLVAREVPFAETGDQLHLGAEATGGHGLRCVVSAAAPDAPEAPGLISHLYEVTNLVDDHGAAAARYAELFGLDGARFCPIESADYGYRGALTMFEPRDRLDRIEVVTPYDLAKTMGRFMQKRGPCLYMCFAEAPDLGAVRERLTAHAPHDWTGSATAPVPDTLFIHPKALAGLLMGVSRTSVGWGWSGHPERVRPSH
jgi:hypothetical protein